MIVFGVCAGPGERFERIAGPSLATRAPDSQVIVLRDQPSIAVAYNRILDSVAGVAALEAVVLIHDDVELVDTGWQAKLTDALHGGETAVVGVIGASGSGGMAWFTRDEKRGAVCEPGHTYDFGDRSAPVGVIDGLFIGLSPWAIANLRFDEKSYPPFHGYDADICSRALAAGRGVRLAPIDLVHHTKGAFGSTKSYTDWIMASLAWRIAWATTTVPRRWLLRARKALVPLEVRLRPSTRARRRDLIARQAAPAQLTTANGGS